MLLEAGAAAAYAVEISALQTYQSKLLGIMDSMVAQSVTLGVNTAAASSGTAGLGNFPEAQQLASKYQASMQALMTNFEEITQLVNTMTDVLGKAGKNYAETEQQLTDQFNKIAAQYSGKAGSFTTTPDYSGPGGPASGYGSSSSSSSPSTSNTSGATGSSGTTGQTYSISGNSSSNSSTTS